MARRLLRHRFRGGLPDGVEVGRHTYDYDRRTFPMFTEEARIVVGAFCSIAPEVRILGGGEHQTGRASLFPMNARFFDARRRTAPDAVDRGATVVGNDVWLGFGAIVLAGSTIGDGAVVGAGAVVREPVPPYAVVVGNPARLLRYRFDARTRERLSALAWWTWDDQDIRRCERWFMDDIETFLDGMEDRRARHERRAAP